MIHAGVKTKVKNTVRWNMALVEFGKNREGTFESYRTVALDRQRLVGQGTWSSVNLRRKFGPAR